MSFSDKKHPGSSRKLKSFATFLLSFLVVWLALSPTGRFFEFEPVVWTAASGLPTPKRFSYVLFPRTPDVRLLENPEGTPGEILNRAVICSEEERLADKFLPIQTLSGQRFTAFENLTSQPPPEWQRLIQGLESRFADMDRSLKFESEAGTGGSTLFTLRNSDDKYARSFSSTWKVVDERAVPVEMRSSNIGTAATSMVFQTGRVIVSMCAAAGVLAFLRRRAPAIGS